MEAGYAAVGSHYLRSSRVTRVACRLSLLLLLQLFSTTLLLLFNGTSRRRRGRWCGVRGVLCGRRLCKWQVTPFIWTFWKRKENIAFHSGGQFRWRETDRWCVCVRARECVCEFVCVWKNNSASLASFIISFLNSCCCCCCCCLRCLALFPVSDAVGFY